MGCKSKKEVIKSIQSVSKLIGGGVLKQKQFFTNSDCTKSDVLRHFIKWSDACKAAGVAHDTSRDRIPDEALLSDWGKVTRDFRHVPSLNEYRLEGRFSRNAFDRFGKWKDLPNVFIEFAGNSDEWKDVVKIIRQVVSKPQKKKATAKTKSGRKNWHGKLDDRPVYGNPIDFRGLRHEPVNENGVLFLFGMVARELGYLVEAIQSGFPDCEAKRKISRGKWQPIRIEFEYASKNFEEHNHDPEKCDVIIC